MVIWFIHVLTMSGASAAIALRLWGERDDWLARLLIMLMGIPALLSLQAIVLVFTARGVKLTWKFSITLFTSAFLMDAIMTMFAVGMIKPRRKAQMKRQDDDDTKQPERPLPPSSPTPPQQPPPQSPDTSDADAEGDVPSPGKKP